MDKKQTNKSFLNNFDVLGVIPKLSIDGDIKYQTKFGSILSFILFSIVCCALWVYGKDIYYKKNPSSIQTDAVNKHPEYF